MAKISHYLTFECSEVNFTYSSNCIDALVRSAAIYCLGRKFSRVLHATVRIINKSIWDSLEHLKLLDPIYQE